MNGAVNRDGGSDWGAEADVSLEPAASCAASTMTARESGGGLTPDRWLCLACSCPEKSPRQSRGQVTRRLITRLGEVIGANGALIERHRQSGTCGGGDVDQRT